MIFFKVFLLFTASILLGGCEFIGYYKRQCEWELELEPRMKQQYEKLIKKNYRHVCARNREADKQDCRFQANKSIYEEAQGKKFRLVDVEYDPIGIPRPIIKITYCK